MTRVLVWKELREQWMSAVAILALPSLADPLSGVDPALRPLVVLVGLIYSFYLFFLGVPVMKKSTPDKAVPFTIVVVVSAIVLMYLLGMIARSLGFGFGMGGGSMGMGPMGVLH